jgi:hypothetical protein
MFNLQIHFCNKSIGSVTIFSIALSAHSGSRPLILFRNHFFTVGRTPVARPLPKQRTTQTQNKRIHTPNIHALSGIRTHDPSVRAREDSSYLRPRSYCDRQCYHSQSSFQFQIILLGRLTGHGLKLYVFERIIADLSLLLYMPIHNTSEKLYKLYRM